MPHSLLWGSSLLFGNMNLLPSKTVACASLNASLKDINSVINEKSTEDLKTFFI
jgi:hypothetical protein